MDQSMTMLMKNEKMPKVKIIIGKDSIFKIGLIKKFAIAIADPIKINAKMLFGK